MTPSDDAEIKKPLTDKQLDILNDHYKDTFTRLRESEQARDRLFLWLIGVFALLSLEIGSPTAVGGSLGKVSIAGGELNLQALPLPALLDLTWVLALVIGLQYCQLTVRVNRQYPYLHALEETISPAVGDGELYQREGKVYLREYPLLLDVAWFAYGILFPLLVMSAALWLAMWEWFGLSYSLSHRIVDAFIALALVGVFFLYLMQPTIVSRCRTWKMRRYRRAEKPHPSEACCSML